MHSSTEIGQLSLILSGLLFLNSVTFAIFKKSRNTPGLQ